MLGNTDTEEPLDDPMVNDDAMVTSGIVDEDEDENKLDDEEEYEADANGLEDEFEA